MQVGTVQKLITILNHSFHEMGVSVSLEKLENLAVTIHRAMTVQARHFHNLEHVFTFVDPADPIRTMSALYHDIVYYQVDMGFSPQISELISPYLRQENGEFYLAENLPRDDRLVMLTLDVFDLHHGQKISSVTGLNEFLSALVMNKQLDGLVPEKDLLCMTLCVEATIPFRGLTPEGKTHFEIMEQRLREISDRHGLALSQDELIETIKIAVTFANKDIENFAEPDPDRVLDNTWKLLPETNAALRMPDVYSIGAYRQALQKMENFLLGLNPDLIFSQYNGVPTNDEYRLMTRYARNNITIAREYLTLRILATVILEALAKATGGDAPLSLFLGDIPREGVSIKRLEYFLPDIDAPAWVDHNSVIYHLLEAGRSGETSFDMKNSPLSLFVYKAMPPEKISATLLRAQEFYDGHLSAHDFLMELDPAVVQPIARASSIMVFTRRQALLAYTGEAA
jgi:hypothetical protein